MAEGPSTNPYVGPRSFRTSDKQRFFGRDLEARDLLNLVLSERLVLFYAQSGAGKSSLINARLVPELEERDFFVLPVGRVSGSAETEATSEVTNVFIYNLLTTINSRTPEPKPEVGPETTLAEYLRAYSGEDEESAEEEFEVLPQVLIVDQFEELVTTHLEYWEQREEFFVQVRDALRADPQLWIVLTMREDYVAELDPYAYLLPNRLQSRFYMQRMQKSAAIEAITGPANEEGVEFAADAVEDLVNNLLQIQTRVGDRIEVHTGQFVQPVQLQVVCYQLWPRLEEDQDGVIQRDELLAIADNDLSGYVSNALAAFYERALQKVLEEEKLAITERRLRNWFSNELITPNGTRSLVYQDRTQTGSLPNDAVAILENQYLVRAESRAGGTWYELVHDRFVEPVLQANEEWRESQFGESPLARRAKQWEADNYPTSLLYQDEQLAGALIGLDRDALDPLVDRFLNESEDAQKERDMVAAQQEARDANLQKRRLQVLAGVAILATIIAGGLFIWANSGWDEAIALRVTAETAQADALAQATAAATSEAAAVQARRIAEIRRQEAISQSVAADAARTDAIALAEALQREQLRTQARSLAEGSMAAADPIGGLLLAGVAAKRVQKPMMQDDLDTRLRVLSALYRNFNQLDSGTTIFSSSGIPTAITLSNDGSQIALAFEVGHVEIWNTLTGEFLYALYGISSDIPLLSYSPDTRFLITGGAQGLITVWNLAFRSVETVLESGSDSVSATVFHSKDDEILFVGGQNGSLEVWNFLEASQLARTDTGTAAIVAMAFLPESEEVVAVNEEGDTFRWNWQVDSQPESGRNNPVSATQFAFDGTGQRLAALAGDELLVWSDLDREPDRFCCFSAHVAQLRWSSNANQLLVHYGLGDVEVWDLGDDGSSLTVTPASTEVTDLTVAQDGSSFAVILGDSNAVEVLPLTGEQQVLELVAASDEAWIWSEDYGYVAFPSEESGELLLLRLDHDGETEGHAIPLRANGDILTYLVSPDHERIALVTDVGGQYQFELGSLEELDYRLIVTVPILDQVDEPNLTFSGALDAFLLLVSGGKVDSVTAYNADTGELVKDPLIDSLNSLTLSPFQTLIAPDRPEFYTVIGETLRLIDADGSQQVLGRAVDPVSELTLQRGGEWIGFQSVAGDIVIVDGENGSEVLRYQPKIDPVSIAISPQGRWLALASDLGVERDERGIRLLPIGSEESAVLTIPYQQGVSQVYFASENRLLFQGRSEEQDDLLSLRILDVAQLAELLCRRVTRNLTFGEFSLKARDFEDVNETRLCEVFPLHESIVLESLRNENIVVDRSLIDDRALLSAQILLAQDRIDNADFEAAWAQLERAVAEIQDHPDLGVQLAETTLNLCSISSDEPISAEACESTRQIALDMDNLGLSTEVCQIARIQNRLETLGDVCAQASELAIDSDNLQINVDLCASSNVPGLEMMDINCDHVAKIADSISSVPVLYQSCQSAVSEQLDSLIQPLCGRAVSLLQTIDETDFGAADSDLARQLCSTRTRGDYEEIFLPACQRFGQYTPEITVGAVEPGEVRDAEGNFYLLDEGDATLVSIELNSVPDENGEIFDTYLSVFDLRLNEVASNDDYQGLDSAILGLPTAEGPYFVLARGLGGRTGNYELKVSAEYVTRIEPGSLVTGTFDSLERWAFAAQAGDVLSATLLIDNGLPFSADLELFRETEDGSMTIDFRSGEDGQTRFDQYFLRADSDYSLRVSAPEDVSSAYTLTVEILETTPIVFNEPQQGTARAYQFEGDYGDVISLELDFQEADMAPPIELLSPELFFLSGLQGTGQSVSLTDYVLNATGTYYLRLDPYEGDHDIRLSQVKPPVIQAGQIVSSTTEDTLVWTVSLQNELLARLQMIAQSDGYDPVFQLISVADGRSYFSTDGLRPLEEAILEGVRFKPENTYLVQIQNPGFDAEYSLSFTEIDPVQIELGAPVSQTFAKQSVWSFAAEPGQVVSITLQTNAVDFSPQLRLIDQSGNDVAFADSGDHESISISSAILSSEGNYLLFPRGGEPDGEYRLTVHEMEIPLLQIGDIVDSDSSESQRWRLVLSEPAVYNILFETEDPNLTLNLKGSYNADFWSASTSESGQLRFTGLLQPALLIELVGGDADPEFRLSVVPGEASELTPDEEQSGNTAENMLWRFEARAGDVVTISLEGASPRFDPFLTLFDEEGRMLSRDDDGGDGYNSYDARISNFQIPEDGIYYVRTGRPNSMEPFTLTLRVD